MFIGKSTINGPFSIAMLLYQRVHANKIRLFIICSGKVEPNKKQKCGGTTLNVPWWKSPKSFQQNLAVAPPARSSESTPLKPGKSKDFRTSKEKSTTHVMSFSHGCFHDFFHGCSFHKMLMKKKLSTKKKNQQGHRWFGDRCRDVSATSREFLQGSTKNNGGIRWSLEDNGGISETC